MLEIRVCDQVSVSDSFDEVVTTITTELRKWFDSDRKVPFTVEVRAIGEQGPPTLYINVGSGTKVGEALR